MKTQFNLRQLGVLTLLATSLGLAGCSDSDSKGIVLERVHANLEAGEWASIKNLDPNREECVQCHGKDASLSPNGGKGHNIGLKNNTDHSAYADLKITGVKVEETSGEVTVTLNQALPANAGNLSMTFAKLAPRVIHNRGHDWQNYFSSNATGRGGNEPKASFMPNGGVQPVTVPSPQVNGKTITFNLNNGANNLGFKEHDFEVRSAYDTKEATNLKDGWEYKGVLGTKMKMGADLASHMNCDIANKDANQYESETTYTYEVRNNQGDLLSVENSKMPVCWWPDGTHLTAGTFVTTDNEFVVEYNPDQTHRVTIILGSSAGNPGFNTWYDFVPSVANGKDPADIKVTVGTNTVITAASYVKANGEVNALAYDFNDGRGVIGSDTPTNADNAIKDADSGLFQALPAARDVVDVQSCNSCHDGLTMHGGSGRSQTQTCVTCHNPGNLQASSGRSVDFKQLVHRIHRGADLPSEQTANVQSNPIQKDKDGSSVEPDLDADGKVQTNTVTAISSLMKNSLLADGTASNFTKVRFPQGPTPGSAAGITNCVKCHMGEETKSMVQGLADELGADNYDVQSKMKLAKVTPQGDNWLAVRSVNACQACHDSNVWFSGDSSISALNSKRYASDANFGKTTTGRAPNINVVDVTPKDPTESKYLLDKYMPFYSDDYAGIGYEWLGKKLSRNESAGWIHNTAVAGDNGRFTCGSGGGCHGNNAIDDLTKTTVGNRQGNAIQQVHLELTRNFILADRFEIEITEPKVTAAGVFSAKVQVKDKQTGDYLKSKEDFSAKIPGLTEVALPSVGHLAWMHDSPDYNHSPGIDSIPGSPIQINFTWADNSDEASVTYDLTTMPRSVEWNKIKGDFKNVIGTFAVQGSVNTYRVMSAVKDFRFDGEDLAADEGRRKVVDFKAGSGIDESRDRYAGWDKEHGSNTQSCSSCHLQLAYHGGGRADNVQLCVMCHNPQRTDINHAQRRGVLRAEDGQYEESLDFKRLIHAVHAAADMRKDSFYSGQGPNGFAPRKSVDADGKPLKVSIGDVEQDAGLRGNSFPGVLSNCKSCHIENGKGQWTFELDQLPKGMIGSTAITADWSLLAADKAGTNDYDPDGKRHDFANHLKMTPIASVCSSCHDAGYKGGDDKARMNNNILDGGPYVGSHWWVMGGIAPGIVPDNGTKPSATKHQSGK